MLDFGTWSFPSVEKQIYASLSKANKINDLKLLLQKLPRQDINYTQDDNNIQIYVKNYFFLKGKIIEQILNKSTVIKLITIFSQLYA